MLPLALCAAASMSSVVSTANAQAIAIAPKVCVVVAGDPDRAVVDLASRLHQRLALRAEVRVIADEHARALLLGQPVEGAVSDVDRELQTARAGLSFGDDDARALDRVAERLGCASVVEVSARPAGLAARRYDAVERRMTSALAPGVVDVATLERLALPSLAPASASGASPAVARPTTPGTAAPAPSAAPAPAAQSLMAPPRIDHDATSDLRGRVAPDPLAPSPRSPSAAPAPRGPLVWPWVVAGGAAAALVTGFLIAQANGPATAVVTVTRPAGGAP